MKGLIFTYVMAYGGAVVALAEPWIGLLIYIMFAILRPETLWFYAVQPGNYSRIVAVAMLLGWVMRGLGNWRFHRGGVIVALFTLFFAWSAICSLGATRPEMAWQFVESLAKIYLPFLVGVTLVSSLKMLKQLAWTIVVSEGYLGWEMNVYYVGGYNWAQEGFGDLGRAVLGMNFVAALTIAFFVMLVSERMWQKAIAGFCCLTIGHSVLLTYSRGALLALLLAGGLSFVMIRKQRKHYMAFAAALVVAGFLAGPSVRERFLETFEKQENRDASAEGRLQLWKDCIDVMSKNPIFGVGPNHWPIVAPKYGWDEGKEAHTLWLQTGAEMGVPGLAFLASFYGVTMLLLWPIARDRSRREDVWIVALARGVIAGLAGFCLAAQFVTVELLEPPYYIVILGVGILKLRAMARAAPGTLDFDVA
jgi:probable O-glycosylation ligase (exosortase A-associated)